MPTIRTLAIALMVVMIGGILPLGAASNNIGTSTPTHSLGFYAGKGEYIVQVRPDAQAWVYLGQELSFQQNGKKVCVPLDGKAEGQCPKKFVGAVRGVNITFTANRVGDVLPTTLRERVTLVRQSAGLPERPVFEFSVPVVDGVASDIQAWGYDESAIPKNEAKETRKGFLGSWREYRQELFVGDSETPFAVITWRHTANSIEIVDSKQVHHPTLAAEMSRLRD